MADLPLLGLAMMLKNEAESVTPLIESVRDVVDLIVLLDTGSTDNTIQLARQAAGSVPIEVYEEPFVDFGTTRSRCLDLLGTRTVFSLMLSGDEVVKGAAELRAFCRQRRGAAKEGAYNVSIRLLSLLFDSPRLARTARGWRYVGPVHECLTHPGEPPTEIRVPKVEIAHDRRGATTETMRATWEGHVRLLLGDLQKNPESPRSHFYLAQSYNCLGRPEDAIPWYQKRISLGGWPAEIFESLLAIAVLRHARGDAWEEVEQDYLAAYLRSPDRAEPLFHIANHYRKKDDWPRCYPFAKLAASLPLPARGALFPNLDIYSWMAADVLAVCCYYAGHVDEGRAAAQKALRACPRDERLKKNLAFFDAL